MHDIVRCGSTDRSLRAQRNCIMYYVINNSSDKPLFDFHYLVLFVISSRSLDHDDTNDYDSPDNHQSRLAWSDGTSNFTHSTTATYTLEIFALSHNLQTCSITT
ncbi:PREDICTED: uncharacterized protein LOC105558897 [Vollenhovia emeryi]|uniref:uncharacterized protein LOC105558897 n=1 Tax=Vollenhovia emeryi TaxID=411798 RepID=UPI0005F4741F|nr:PREDICTED: uncharacterized protein LOC105558897 [Vollenhovia emeryi]